MLATCEPRRGLDVVLAGLRRPRGARPVHPGRAGGAAGHRRLRLQRQALRRPRHGRRAAAGSCRRCAHRPRRARRRARARCRTRSRGRRRQHRRRRPRVRARWPFADPLWVLYSSGTTGLPKPILHGHGGDAAGAREAARTAPRPRARRPVPLVHHDRLDDVEPARLRPRRRRRRSCSTTARRRTRIRRAAVAARRRRAAHLLRRVGTVHPGLHEGGPASRGRARPRSRCAARRLDRSAAAARGFRLGLRARGARRACSLDCRAGRMSAPRSSVPCRRCRCTPARSRAGCSACAVDAFDAGRDAGGRRGGRAGDHRADAVDAGRRSGATTTAPGCARPTSTTFPGVWRHGDWIKITPRGLVRHLRSQRLDAQPRRRADGHGRVLPGRRRPARGRGLPRHRHVGGRHRRPAAAVRRPRRRRAASTP